MPSSFEGSRKIKASPEKILDLINNFQAYREFLPGCLESSRLPDTDKGLICGKLVFSILNKTYSFESENETIGHEVQIKQLEGPFLDFYALWSLEPIDEKITLVKFKANFKLPLFLRIFGQQNFLDRIGGKFIEAFEQQLQK